MQWLRNSSNARQIQSIRNRCCLRSTFAMESYAQDITATTRTALCSSEARLAAFNYIQALVSPVERKNGWQMAEQVGYANPYRFQHLLGRAEWNADAVCAEIKQYAVEHLKSKADILAIDETDFFKQVEQSVGAQGQYYGTTGHLENCQVGVFMSYISDKGHTLVDRRLYLPQSWAIDALKRKKRVFLKQPNLLLKLNWRNRCCNQLSMLKFVLPGL